MNREIIDVWASGVKRGTTIRTPRSGGGCNPKIPRPDHALSRAVRLTRAQLSLLSGPMRRRLHVVLVLLLAACTSNPVGRICDLGTTVPEPSETVVASPSLDCVSRTCLRVPLQRALPMGSTFPPGNTGLCTAECSADTDCDRVPESPCKTGFSCGIAVTVGPFCCRKFCICKDYIVIPDTGSLATPMACVDSNPLNECCNLSGRTGNAMYPLCKK